MVPLKSKLIVTRNSFSRIEGLEIKGIFARLIFSRLWWCATSYSTLKSKLTVTRNDSRKVRVSSVPKRGKKGIFARLILQSVSIVTSLPTYFCALLSIDRSVTLRHQKGKPARRPRPSFSPFWHELFFARGKSRASWWEVYSGSSTDY